MEEEGKGMEICRVIKQEGKDGKCAYILKDCEESEICKTVKTGKKDKKGNDILKFGAENKVIYEMHLNANGEKVQVKKGDKFQENTFVTIMKYLQKIEDQYQYKNALEQNPNVQLSDEEKTKSNQYGVWILRITTGSQDKYINIASSKDILGEIKEHIKDLLYTGSSKTTKTKAETYQNLWGRTQEVVFEEIFVDKSIDEWIKKEKMDPYLKSLIAPEENQKPKEGAMKDMFDKLRAQYVEGRLAGEERMASKEQAEKSGVKYDGGIWNAGTGIDGEVYKYYA